jgi:hypothetical protein
VPGPPAQWFIPGTRKTTAEITGFGSVPHLQGVLITDGIERRENGIGYTVHKDDLATLGFEYVEVRRYCSLEFHAGVKSILAFEDFGWITVEIEL